MISPIRSRLYIKQMSQTPSIRTRLVHQLITFGALFQRPMTLGVRGLIIDKNDRVLLVKHTYVSGFYLPGGGVEAGEAGERSEAQGFANGWLRVFRPYGAYSTEEEHNQ